jgi:hypothetical protein
MSDLLYITILILFLFTDVEKTYNELLDQVSAVLFNNKNKSEGSSVVINTLGWKRTEVISLDDKAQSPSKKQRFTFLFILENNDHRVFNFLYSLSFIEVGEIIVKIG